MKKRKVIAAGHICLDITPVFPVSEGRGARLVPGGLVHVENADVHTGGLVANTGLAMKFFGLDVKLMGKIGSDPFGKIVLSELERFDAAQGMIIAPGETTSYSVVLALPGIDRCFLHCPGANATFSPEDISPEALEGCSLFHFGYPTLMTSMYQNNGAALEALMQSVSSRGVTTSMDLSSVDPASDAGRQNWASILEGCLKYTDIFLPSAEEIVFMLDRERVNDFTLDTISAIGQRLVAMGSGIVIIKCGAEGIYYKTADAGRLQQIGEKLGLPLDGFDNQEGFVKSFKPSQIASATGAGDTSIAAFLSAMLMEYSFEDCLNLMAAAGACCVESYNALDGLKPLKQLKEKINDGWERQGGVFDACKFK